MAHCLARLQYQTLEMYTTLVYRLIERRRINTLTGPLRPKTSRLEHFQPLIEAALIRAQSDFDAFQTARSEGKQTNLTPFDTRSELYDLAMEFAGNKGRRGDLLAMYQHIRPVKGEISVDLAAGTGFLTNALFEWTSATVYAVDSSQSQLAHLQRHCSRHVVPILARPERSTDLFDKGRIPRGGIDFVTSFGGIHHLHRNGYDSAFQNIATMLRRGGRFSAADVAENTSLQQHFDEVVESKCITRHEMGRFMSRQLLERLADGAGLRLVRTEMQNLTWTFDSANHMAWFFKGLHAYPQHPDEVLEDLRTTLGFEERMGQVWLNWPMLFWEIVKP